MQDLKSKEFYETLQRTLKEFIPTLHSWMEDGSRVMDPFELEYSENYATANAAVIVSSVYNDEKDPTLLETLDGLIGRCVDLLKDREGVSPFCRVFIIHYSLMAICILPKSDREVFASKYGKFYSNYIDDCKQINTNCAALQLGTEIFLCILGYRKSKDQYMAKLISFIHDAQKKSGFINDDISANREEFDGMPIAYHGFILYILIGIISLAKLEDVHKDIEDTLPAIEQIVEKGTGWLKQAISRDGRFAMVGRSSYQVFTWGVLMVISSYYNLEDGDFLKDIYKDWSIYKKPDGSYSCTPNYLPHGMRVGYESYTHVNMYNGLALTGLAITKHILGNGLQITNKNLSKLGDESSIIDYDSGYAFIRKGDTFLGCTLRTHSRMYAPSMQGFHIRLNGDKLPIVESKILGETEDISGPFEGFCLVDSYGTAHYPLKNENVRAHILNNGISMEFEDEALVCKKIIEVREYEICWKYSIKAKEDMKSCMHVIPLLVHDGKDELNLSKESDQCIVLTLGGRKYNLTCDSSKDINLSLDRSSKSISGISSNLHIHISDDLGRGEEIQWCTKLTIL